MPLFCYRHSDILVLYNAVGSRRLFHQHPVVFLAIFVQSVIAQGHEDGAFKVRLIQPPIVDGDFGGSSAVKGIQKLRIGQKHGFLVLLGGYRVIDILKMKAHGEFVSYPENSIWPQGTDGNGLLYSLGIVNFPCPAS